MTKSAPREISDQALAASLFNLGEAVALKRKKIGRPARRQTQSLNERFYSHDGSRVAHATARETARRLGEKED